MRYPRLTLGRLISRAILLLWLATSLVHPTRMSHAQEKMPTVEAAPDSIEADNIAKRLEIEKFRLVLLRRPRTGLALDKV